MATTPIGLHVVSSIVAPPSPLPLPGGSGLFILLSSRQPITRASNGAADKGMSGEANLVTVSGIETLLAWMLCLPDASARHYSSTLRC